MNVLVVACPFCAAAPGERCTKSGMPGKCREQLRSIAGHPSRIIAAALASGYDETQARAIAAAHSRGQARKERAGWTS